MNKVAIKAGTLSILLLSIFCCHALSDIGEIERSQSFVSPNGRFVAQFAPREILNFKITDNKTKTEVYLSTFTLLSMRWTGDSKTIVTVEHIAGGSETALIHLFKNRWTRFEVQPPLAGGTAYAVVAQNIGWNIVNITYKVFWRVGLSTDCWTCSFDVNPETKAITKEVNRKIDPNTYRTIKEVQMFKTD